MRQIDAGAAAQQVRQGGAGGPGLSPRRREIIRVIEDSLQSRGYPPSLREIGAAVGLASTSSVSHQMSVLEATGYLSRETRRPRTAVLRGPDGPGPDAGPAVPDDKRMTAIPVVGRIAAGEPILADGAVDYVMPLPRLLTGDGSLIALRVTGDSMIDAAITHGDWVVVRCQPDADNGDIVAALLESDVSADREATVKTLKRADGHTWLIPHNPVYAPILADRAEIIGKVVSVLRRLLRGSLRLQLPHHRERVVDVPADVGHRVEHVPDGAGAVDHVGDPAGDQAKHRGHAVALAHPPALIAHQGERQLVMLGEGGVLALGVRADPDHLDARRREHLVTVAERARLGRAAARLVLRVEVQHHDPVREAVRQRDPLTGLRYEGEVGGLVAYLNAACHAAAFRASAPG
jgi:repressor LexA